MHHIINMYVYIIFKTTYSCICKKYIYLLLIMILIFINNSVLSKINKILEINFSMLYLMIGLGFTSMNSWYKQINSKKSQIGAWFSNNHYPLRCKNLITTNWTRAIGQLVCSSLAPISSTFCKSIFDCHFYFQIIFAWQRF